ncbi:hypothetical protein Zmor_004949 [Zophobas morio]|uniref:MSP domain-containing protein n=1 Tax=Zophobas morio TaxID=2755281 RepID=A0AA38MLG7_9CUCU|nr:hypothetical protein Zmor_004949 [Zophobas morio]
MSLKDRSIPVFIYPSELTFFVGSQITHKQLLTLYNPYEFPVKYQVYANTADRYGVVDPKGTIAPHSYIDLLVRHNAPFPSNCHNKDRFMITMQDATTNQLLGRRCVPSTLLPGEKDTSSVGDDSSHSYTACESSPIRERGRNYEPDSSVKYYFMMLSVLFILVLIMPTKCDEPEATSIPSYLHVSVAVKIITAYVLGLITMSLLKPC